MPKRLPARPAVAADLLLPAFAVAAMFLMVLPVHTRVLDVLLSLSITAGVLLLSAAFYVREPLLFSTFPTLVALTTVFRLALSIATTRLVLGDADAGALVAAVGEAAVDGNVLIGLAAFFVVTVVQFLVVAKGAERASEVGARFKLDAMPVQYSLIGNDLHAGVIGKPEADGLRDGLRRLGDLAGSMEGAAKFIKGDAVAGLVIILVNLLVGLCVGVLQRGMSFGEAVDTYTLLTVGDGLVTQLPALFTAVALGVTVTRVDAAGGQGGDLGSEIAGQLLSDPRPLVVAAAAAGLLGLLGPTGFMPGLPYAALLAVAAGCAALAWRGSWVRGARAEAAGAARPSNGPDRTAPLQDVPPVAGGDRPLRLILEPDLFDALPRRKLERCLWQAAASSSGEFGVPIPPAVPVRAEPGALGTAPYRIELHGVRIGAGAPAPQAPGRAGGAGPLPAARGTGAADPDALAAAVASAVRLHAGRFVGAEEALGFLEAAFRERFASTTVALKEICPGWDPPTEAGEFDLVGFFPLLLGIKTLLQCLVEEGLSLAHRHLILAAAAQYVRGSPGTGRVDPDGLVEAVRAGLRPQLCERHADAGGAVRALEFLAAPDADDQAASSARPDAPPRDAWGEPISDLVRRIEAASAQTPGRPPPVVITRAAQRLTVRKRLLRRGCHAAVFALEDITPPFRIEWADQGAGSARPPEAVA